MSSHEKAFSHISIDMDDDDDFVIHVGSSAVCPVAEKVADVTPVPESVDPVVDQLEEKEVVSEQLSQSPAVEGARKEQTLQDLDSIKMSGMQKIIIACALVGLVLTVLYAMFFMS